MHLMVPVVPAASGFFAKVDAVHARMATDGVEVGA
jgi:hypothetical protein